MAERGSVLSVFFGNGEEIRAEKLVVSSHQEGDDPVARFRGTDAEVTSLIFAQLVLRTAGVERLDEP